MKISTVRNEEFEGFHWDEEPPDPQAEETFNSSKLQWHKRKEGRHRTILQWYRELTRLRRTEPVLQNLGKSGVRVDPLGRHGFVLHRQSGDGQQHIFCLFNLSEKALTHALPNLAAKWEKMLDSKESNWLENGQVKCILLPWQTREGEELRLPPLSVAVYKGVQ